MKTININENLTIVLTEKTFRIWETAKNCFADAEYWREHGDWSEYDYCREQGENLLNQI